jgi:hypothetical protein
LRLATRAKPLTLKYRIASSTALVVVEGALAKLPVGHIDHRFRGKVLGKLHGWYQCLGDAPDTC